MFDDFRETLPDPFDLWFGWLMQPQVLGLLAFVSVATLVLSVVAIPWLVSGLPPDYFTAAREQQRRVRGGTVWWRVLVGFLRNALGGFLVFAGVLMLFLPGQGLATIIAGLLVMRFRRKREMLRRLARRPRVQRAMNALRRRAGREPFRFDDGVNDA